MEAELLQRLRDTTGERETDEERQRARVKAAVADAYDKGDMRVESHWSEKALAKMTERDWRIFRYCRWYCCWYCRCGYCRCGYCRWYCRWYCR